MTYIFGVLRKLIAGLDGSEHAGTFEIILGEPPLKARLVEVCPRHQGADVGWIDQNDGRQIIERLLWTVEFQQDVAAKKKGFLLIGSPAVRNLWVEQFVECQK